MAQQSSSFNGSFGSNFELVIKLDQINQSIEHNTSTVRAEVYYQSKYSHSTVIWYGSPKRVSLSICGVNETIDVNPNLSGGQSKLIFTKNYTVTHKDDGSQFVTGTAHFDGSGITHLGNATVSLQLTLQTIPRGSTVGNVTATLGTSISIPIHKTLNHVTHRVRYKIGTYTGELGNHVEQSVTWTPSLELAKYITNSDTGTGILYTDTYKDGKFIDTKTSLLTLKIPPSVRPTIQNIVVTEQNTQIADVLSQQYLQSFSHIRCQIVGDSGVYGSTIVSRSIRFGDTVYQGERLDKTNVLDSGQVTITAIVTDSRGRTAEKSTTITILPYTLPAIVAFMPARTGNGTNTAMQAQVIVNAKSVLVDNTNKNPYKVVVHRSERGKNSWELVYEATSTAERFGQVISLGTGYASEKAYDIRLTITDAFNQSQSSVVTVGTIRVVLALGKHNVGIGKIPDDHVSLDVEGAVQASDGFYKNGQEIQHKKLTETNGKVIRWEKHADELLETGFYYMQNNRGRPENTNGYTLVESYDNQLFIKQTFTNVYTGKTFIRVRTNGKWGNWKEVSMVIPSTWQSTGIAGIDYKRVGDIVYIRLNVTLSTNGTVALGTLPKGWVPSSGLMLLVPAWHTNTTVDKHLQINQDGGMHLLNNTARTNYRTQLSFCI